jgi:predicted membrane protein
MPMPSEQTGETQRVLQPRRRKDTSGPIVFILIVATIIFLATNEAHNAEERQTLSGDSTFSSYAFLSGVETRNNSSTFRGGSASAVMGGAKLDFRDATMEGDQATIDISAIMGGVELYVPRTWEVVNHIVPVLGGVNDHTSQRAANKRLIVKGTVLMGGLDIRN